MNSVGSIRMSMFRNLRYQAAIATALVFMFSAHSAFAASAQAVIDREKIYLDESVTLVVTIQSESDNVGGAPDLSELQSEFEVLSEATQTNVQIINGATTVERSWVFDIKPKRVGTITIPSIAVGQFRTNALQLVVEKFTGNVQSAGSDLFLEIEATPRNPYVQSQVILKIRLFTSIGISQGRLSEANLPFADVQQLGQDRRYSSKRGDTEYNVIERRYAVFPEQSGTHEIPSFEFSGVVSRYSQSTLQTEFFRERISSESVVLEVRPKPSAYSGKTWLPASDLQLIDSWNGRLPDLEIGRPESRQISIEAIGLRAVQLATPEYDPNQSVRVYSNRPDLNTLQTASATIAQRDEEFVIIPNSTADVTIPEFKVVWWDVEEEREKVALLPEISNASAVAGVADTTNTESATATNETAPVNDLAPVSSGKSDTFWMMISIGILIMWLITLAGWYVSRRGSQISEEIDEIERDQAARNIKQTLREIRKSCQENDVVQVADRMHDLARLWWPDHTPRNLIDIGTKCADEEFKEELKYLDWKLYSGDSAIWDGSQFWEHLVRVQRSVRSTVRRPRRGFFSRQSQPPSEELWFEQELTSDRI